MPKIELKPRSPCFTDDDSKNARQRCCDMPGCPQEGAHKAPKDSSLTDHYWFCYDHVCEYNKAWDFFSGMSARDIEEHIVRSALWDRPTRRYDNFAKFEEELYRKSWQTYHYTDKEPPKDKFRAAEDRIREIKQDTPEFEAMAIMGLEPPLDLTLIKLRYKELAKKYHPDVNKHDPKAEDVLKNINMAYTILKLAYDKYEKIKN